MSPAPVRMRRLAAIVTIGMPLLGFGCSARTGPVERIPDPGPLLALFPVENLSGKPAPLEDIRSFLIERLEAHGLRILDEFRNRYLISYSPAGVSKSGWHRLQVRLKGRRGIVKARAGYEAGS